MSISTYTELTAAVGSWLERSFDGTLTDQTPTFVQLAEAWFNRQLQGYQREVVTTISTDVDGHATLPTGLLGVQGVSYLDTPLNYQISGTEIIVPDYGSYTLDLVYYVKLTPLSESNASNWLLAIAPDAYLFATLSQASIFLQDMQAAALFAAQAQDILTELNLQNTVAQYGRAGLSLRGVAP